MINKYGTNYVFFVVKFFGWWIMKDTINTIALSDEERQPCEIWTRVMGYHRSTASFNKGKKSEFAERVCFKNPYEAGNDSDIKVEPCKVVASGNDNSSDKCA